MLAQFWRQHWRKQPFSCAGSARGETASCTWSQLDGMLKQRASLECLVIARGRLADRARPKSLEELQRLFSEGIGIVVMQAERGSEELSSVCAELRRDIVGEQRVLVFATPRGVNGFGWHYDAEEVFIIQTAGEKEYFFRRNTVAVPRRGAQPDFSLIRQEKSPLMSCRLLPGDWLYLPSGYWHVAKPNEHSLSISIGIFPE